MKISDAAWDNVAMNQPSISSMHLLWAQQLKLQKSRWNGPEGYRLQVAWSGNHTVQCFLPFRTVDAKRAEHLVSPRTGEIILLGEYFWKSSRKGTCQTFLSWLRKGYNPGASFEHQVAAGVVQIGSQELVFTSFACCSSHLIVLVQKMERWVNPQDC